MMACMTAAEDIEGSQVRHERRFRPALVLNADFRPLSYYPLSLWSWQDAVRAVFQDRVTVVETYDDLIHAPSFSMPAPAVIALKEYQNRLPRKAAFTRFNLYLRDRFRCQYCGSRDDLTFDHVIPVSRGGATRFENIVACCAGCNLRKAARTPREAGLTLLRPPHAPDVRELIEIGREFPPPLIFEEWRDYCYWTVPLEA